LVNVSNGRIDGSDIGATEPSQKLSSQGPLLINKLHDGCVADTSECAYLLKFVSNGFAFIVVLSALEVVIGLFWGGHFQVCAISTRCMSRDYRCVSTCQWLLKVLQLHFLSFISAMTSDTNEVTNMEIAENPSYEGHSHSAISSAILIR